MLLSLLYARINICRLVLCKCFCVCVFGFNSVADCCPRRAKIPEFIAPEGADGEASPGDGPRADSGQGEEPVHASTVSARQVRASAEGA